MRKPDDKERGAYHKYDVQRVDGSSGAGGKHEHCFYFVLDMDHDKFAVPAMQAYAQACKDEYPLFAADILEYLERKDKEQK